MAKSTPAPGQASNGSRSAICTSSNGARQQWKKVYKATALLLQDVLSRITDSVVGFWRADFMEKTTDNADL